MEIIPRPDARRSCSLRENVLQGTFLAASRRRCAHSAAVLLTMLLRPYVSRLRTPVRSGFGRDNHQSWSGNRERFHRRTGQRRDAGNLSAAARVLSLVREICDKNGVILIFDEVMSGMGRTGKWFASQHAGVVPDIMTLGKGLSSGSIALSGVATRSEYLDILRGGSGNFVHGGTFSHHAVATAAGLAVVNILERENLVARCADMGLYLGKRLKELLLPLPFVIDVRGIGLMWGVEFAQDKESGTPFPRNHKLTERVREAMYNRGILLYPASALAGKDGDAIIFGPPFTIDTAEIDLAVETLAEVLKETIGA